MDAHTEDHVKLATTLKIALVCGTAGLAVGRASASIEFVGIGRLNGAANSSANGVSADGAFVVGASGSRAVRWTRAGGIADLGTLGFDSAAASAIDNSGLRPVGGVTDTQHSRAFGFGVLGWPTLPPSASSWATGVLSDGSTIVGGVSGPAPTGSHAFVWGQESPQTISYLDTLGGGVWASATGIARMGTTSVVSVIGTSDSLNGPRAVRWTPSVASLGVLPGGTYSYGKGISTSGEVIVGQSDSMEGPRAFRWAGGTMASLGVLPGDTESSANAVSEDGSVVVGSSGTATTSRAFLWTAETGMIDLRTHLSARGVDVSGWTLLMASGVSGDGLTIVGNGGHDNIAEGWVVSLNAIVPCRADFNDSGAISVQDIFDFLASYFAGEFRADFNGSSTLTVQDIFDFLAAYFSGCV